ncbi:unnamed protein product [Brachionus calyciflorus]|uniref:Uncharacterized protein n=1 Tax=Brachionus calyciflorus TaxID=104777 RepID=A0A814HMU1_9BILA|nr:unnamed protein product [Brachionus calyciflorus]
MGFDVFLKNNSIPEPGQCFSDKWVKTYLQCGRLSLVWAVGGAVIQDFPKDLAYPLGGSDKTGKYFFIEIHYDNPKLKSNVRDFSGIRYYTTKNYRQTEFGIFTVGTSESFNGIIVPPKADRYQLDYSCSTECTDKIFDEQPEIKVFSSLPHSHLLGKEIYTTVVRDGKEVAYLANNKYYDFNYQYYNFLNKPVTLKKGDEIRTTCVYSSKDKDTFTYGGLATYHEMW